MCFNSDFCGSESRSGAYAGHQGISLPLTPLLSQSGRNRGGSTRGTGEMSQSYPPFKRTFPELAIYFPELTFDFPELFTFQMFLFGLRKFSRTCYLFSRTCFLFSGTCYFPELAFLTKNSARLRRAKFGISPLQQRDKSKKFAPAAR